MTLPTIAIVSTVRDPGPAFRTWIAYHRQLADRLYIFMDEPDNGDAALIPEDFVVRRLHGEQHSTMSGGNGVMERQIANVERALAMCRAEGIDWLLHIDADELLWSPDQSFKAYLSTATPDVTLVSFANHEVVNTFEVDDCFRELHLFKRNNYCVASDALLSKRKYPFFLFYGNGKSAVRVASCVRPDGVHLFQVAAGITRYERHVCILHYACPAYCNWLKKYTQLGNFQSYWWDDVRNPITFQFHLDSRDAYLDACRTGDWRIAQDFYRKSLFSEAEINAMRQTGAVLHANPLAQFDLDNGLSLRQTA